ncbi:YcjX family protein [Hansschlegelia quercus]|uniref:YcjX family protein n=1 Tax=Hansschlegelia quercus TaxID=2528245 RepID=A0A4Q9GRE7_9HYPH|nr:YcjX family protein [Hansschlegelia quercus]TBN54670.1 YcjX family protein [Hansschlegelia quercus]
MSLESWLDEARIVARSLADAAAGALDPTIRLGVTGLSRAGKTVFLTALVQALTSGGRLPAFRAYAQGRVAGARLAPQPDDAVPRFEVERHLGALLASDRAWPESTNRISELRVVVDFESRGFFSSSRPGRKLTLDIVDYPGEWLLDLALLSQDFRTWSRRTVETSNGTTRAPIAEPWRAHLATVDPLAKENESVAREAAARFTAYLRAGRADRVALSTLPPGRFLMPGDMEGSPALTFAPLALPAEGDAPSGSIWAMMERRYEAYRSHIVKPFFRDHFSRLDRQVVLVDALAALNAGPEAVADLETALSDVLQAFRHGQNSWLSSLFRPRVDRLLFAATKADHLHHTSHDRLEAILRRLVGRAIERAEFGGATVDVVALAAVRATREATVRQGRDELPVIVGVPEVGEGSGGQHFDGEEEIAVFPGDLPTDPEVALRSGGYRGRTVSEADGDIRFVKFRPPKIVAAGGPAQLPHIRLDRTLEFLIGDALA